MDIKELRDGLRGVSVEGEIVSVSPRRTVSKRDGGTSEVADAVLKDDSGTVKVSLWDEQIEQVSKGARVSIANGYVSTFRGERQLSIGRYGTLSVQDSL